MSRTVDVAPLIALSWVNNNPVYFLSICASGSWSPVTSQERGCDVDAVECPAIVIDSHRVMRDADRHDQICLQHYSLQTNRIHFVLVDT